MLRYPRHINTQKKRFWFNVAVAVHWLASLFFIIIFIIIVAGCVSAWPPQNYAGISHLLISFDEAGNVQSVETISGKENAVADFEVINSAGGTVKFSVSGQKAFQGHASRAEVEKALINAGLRPDPPLVEAVMTILDKVN